MSASEADRAPWLPVRTLLLAAVAMMAVCARVPEAGAGWRTAFVIAALIASGLLYLAWRQGTYSTRAVLVLAMALRVVAFPLLPVLSDDGFRYVWDGLVQVEAGRNPYRYVPSDPALAALRSKPVYEHLNSTGYFAVYPPASQFVFALGGLLSPLGWKASWYLIKLLFVLAEGIGVWILSRLAPPRALLLYAWNPLVVIETAGQAHTEALAVPLLLGAAWASRRHRGGWAGAALAAAGWVKLIPLVALPLLLRRHGWRAALGAAVASAVLLLPYAAPYVVPNVLASLDLYVRAFEFNAGLYYALKGLLMAATGEDWSKQLGPCLQYAFVLGTLGVLVLDGKRRLPLPWALALVLGLFFVCATTVHPWYLVPLLALLPLLDEREGRWFTAAWLWLGAVSLATYWRYTGPPWGYEAAVWIGWLGWMLGMALALFQQALPIVMRRRAAWKWRWMQPHLSMLSATSRVLDLGAGEGYVGERIQKETGAEVFLADVVDFRKAALPFVHYDGHTLPFDDGAFDATVLVFVLHHAEDPVCVLREAARVTRGRLLVLESVSEHPLQHRIFERLDRLANGWRSFGAMKAQEAHVNIRSDEAWRALFDGLGLEVVAGDRRRRGVHRQQLYCLNPLLQ